MKKFKITVAALGALMCFINTANAQEKLTYQKPSKEILDLVDVELATGLAKQARSFRRGGALENTLAV